MKVQMEKTNNLKTNLTHWITAIFIFTVPLFFLPITPDFYSWNKRVLILATGIILMLVWSSVSVFKKESSIKVKRKGTLPLICGLLVVTALSLFLNPGFMEGLMGDGALFLGLSFIYFFVTQIEDFSFRYIFYPLLGSSLLLSLISILGNVGILAHVLPWENINPETWTPTGSQFAQLTWLLVTFALAAFLLVKYSQQEFKKSTKETISTMEAVTIGIIIPVILTAIALFSINYQNARAKLSQDPALEPQALQESGPYINLPYRFGWKIATNSLGNSVKSTFIGVGPGNFDSAFRRFKPLEIERISLWQVIFGNSSNIPFHTLTTLGILGLGIWLLIAVKAVTHILGKLRSEEKLDFSHIGLISILIIQVFLSSSALSWLLLFTFLAISDVGKTKGFWLIKASTRFLIALALAGGITYLTFRAYQGEFYYHQSLKAFQNNDGIQTYNLQQRAIQANPKKVSYRTAFATVNRLLVQSYIQDFNQQMQQQSSKQSQEDLEKQQEQLQNQINSLVQQSIDQAKQAISLNQLDATTWLNLAQTYQSFTGLLDGSEDWALIAYGQAIKLDSLNPELRTQRGALYLSQGDFEEAILNFRTAVQIRPRYAPGWYNLAQAYQREEKFPKAAQALENVLTILPLDHEDRTRVEQELENIKSKLGKDEKEALEEGTETEQEESSPSAEPKPQVEGSSFSPFGE
ncbi:MAG: tetratricopeptide repeat protein [Patescibacteria group bacterium]|nr:tetratricopeptide repeat protein [Patescibacteria group bacterium]